MSKLKDAWRVYENHYPRAASPMINMVRELGRAAVSQEDTNAAWKNVDTLSSSSGVVSGRPVKDLYGEIALLSQKVSRQAEIIAGLRDDLAVERREIYLLACERDRARAVAVDFQRERDGYLKRLSAVLDLVKP